MGYRYVTTDVFTDRDFAGNPLAVVLDGRGLTAEAMQSITNEFNYSETTFVLPPEDPAHTAQVRIFTPVGEVPFAGHPNIGTAYVLSRLGELFGKPVGGRLLFEEKAGLVPVDIVTGSDGAAAGAQLTVPEALSIGSEHPVEIVTECVGVPADQVVTANHQPIVASVGLPFLFVELESREALRDLSYNPPAFKRLFPLDGAVGMHLYTRDRTGNGIDLHARMLFEAGEDPATGSANGALVALLAHLNAREGTTLNYHISQGEDMGRPSLLSCQVDKADGAVTAVRVAGSCVQIMAGEITAI